VAKTNENTFDSAISKHALSPHGILRPMATTPPRWCADTVCPSLVSIDEQPVVDKALLSVFRCGNLHSTKFAVTIRKVLEAYVLVICLFVCSEGQVEHAQRAGAELMYRSARRPLAILRWWKRRSSEFVTVTAENYDADIVRGREVPCSFQDTSALI